MYCSGCSGSHSKPTAGSIIHLNQIKPVGRRDRPAGGAIAGFKGGPEKWSGGTLYNPGDGHTYGGSLTLLDPDHLLLKGCVLFGLVCKSQTWTRLKD